MTIKNPFESCEAVLAAIPLLAGEDLEPEVLEGTLRHVAICDACAQALERARVARALLGTLRVETDGPDLWDGVREVLLAEGLFTGQEESPELVLAPRPLEPALPVVAAAPSLARARRASAWQRWPLRASAAALLLAGGLALLLNAELRPGAEQSPAGIAHQPVDAPESTVATERAPQVEGPATSLAATFPAAPAGSEERAPQRRASGSAAPLPGDATFDSSVRLVSTSGGFAGVRHANPLDAPPPEGECLDRHAETGPQALRPSTDPYRRAIPYQPEGWYGEPIDLRQLRWVGLPARKGAAPGLRAAGGNE